jgi:hypothetical protein
MYAGPRIMGFFNYRIVPTTRVGLSVGFRVADIQNDRDGQELGEMTMVPIYAHVMVTPVRPWLGTGRRDDEWAMYPFGYIGVGVWLYEFDSSVSGFDLEFFPSIQDDNEGLSPAAELRMGLEFRLPHWFSFGISGGYYFAGPKVDRTTGGDSNHFMHSSWFGGLHGEIRF